MRDAADKHDPLALQALLYAGGELPADEAAAFEKRLGDDQAARDALVQAVRLTVPLGGRPSTGPDPAYRARVRQRLRPRPGLFRGHPFLWSSLGAVAALLLLAFLPRPQPNEPAPTGPSTAAVPSENDPLAATWPEEPPDAFDIARLWAQMPASDHLERAREDEMRRKVRAEDRQRVAGGTDRRERPLTNTISKPGAEKPR